MFSVIIPWIPCLRRREGRREDESRMGRAGVRRSGGLRVSSYEVDT